MPMIGNRPGGIMDMELVAKVIREQAWELQRKVAETRSMLSDSGADAYLEAARLIEALADEIDA